MLLKGHAVKEEFLAEVAPWMRQDLGTALRSRVTIVDMVSEFLHVIDALLSDKHCATLEANETKCFLMSSLHVSSQALLVREMLPRLAVVDQACHHA